jgi:hypothetical protein
MNRVASNVFLISGVLAIAVMVWLMLRSPASAVVRIPTTSTAARPGESVTKHAVGMSGCLATACHGGPAGKLLSGNFDAGSWQSSGSCWLASDPHAAAYDVLTESPKYRLYKVTAAEIMANLTGDKTKKAVNEPRCLACHTNPALADPGPGLYDHATLQELRSEGVSCEACHGNAGMWLRDHTTWTPGNRHSRYEATGMNPLNDVGERALACAGCHVGAPADDKRGYLVPRDMNHDIIAAGHPRLDFDFGEYLRRIPHHWYERDRSSVDQQPRGPGFPLRAWIVGRVAQAEASCKLLADRAKRSSENKPLSAWPELAEYNCAVCHHNIPDSERSEPGRLGSRPLGTLKWQSIWPLTEGDIPEFAKMGPLLKTMQGKRPATTEKAFTIATETEKELTALRKKIASMPDGDIAKLVKKIIVNPNDPRQLVLKEDDLRQMYEGLAAIERTIPDRDQRTPNWKQDFGFTLSKLRKKEWPEARLLLGKLVNNVPPALP